MYSFKSEILKDLPGIFVEVNSARKKLYDDSQFGKTDAVLCIGTAFDGPNGFPVPIYDPSYAVYTYGDTYDRRTKREVDLVATISDAYNNGCRTIYGFRIGGKEAYKDFAFRDDKAMYLRVKSTFPSNKAKQVYFTFDNTPGEEKITIYKPVSKASLYEKYNALIDETTEVIKVDINLGFSGAGFNSNTQLTEVLRYVNRHVLNNVLVLSIVNDEGQDITLRNDSYDLALGSLFPGTYFIGRSHSLVPIRTEVRTHIIKGENAIKPYDSYDGVYFTALRINTDVSSRYPIYAGSDKEMNEVLTKVGIKMLSHNDYLESPMLSNLAFAEDEVDYEETNMTNFEKYVRLGSGFAITATANKRTNTKGEELVPRVKETVAKDPRYVVGIKDGAYSLLQNADMPYRVLGAQIAADTVIGGRLPKPKDFLRAFAQEVSVFNSVQNGQVVPNTELISITPKVDSMDTKTSARKFKFTFNKIKDVEKIVPSAIFSNEVFTYVPVVDNKEALMLDKKVYKTGQVFFIKDEQKVVTVTSENKLEEFVSKNQKFKHFVAGDKIIESFVLGEDVHFKEVADLSGLQYDTDTTGILKDVDSTAGLYYVTRAAAATGSPINAKYVLMTVNGVLTVASYEDGKVTPIGNYDIIMDKDTRDDKVIAHIENFDNVENKVAISVTDYNYRTLSEFVSDLKENKTFSRLFDIKLTDNGVIEKDTLIEDILEPVLKDTELVLGELPAHKVIDYDYSLRIPYRTSDNFARQLAQHCLNTEMRTAHTHGIIGVERISDYTLSGVAQKVEALKTLSLGLNLKRENGRAVIDDDGMPVNIGGSISMVFMQNNVPVFNSTYSYVGNGGSAYAGLVSALDVEQSPTNQKLKATPLFDLTTAQLSDLTARGIVTAKNTYTRGYVITDGCTMADSSDPMSRLNTVRIIDAVERVIREVCEPFIGKQNKISVRNAIQTGLTSRLNELKGKLLYDYTFDIVNDTEVLQYTYIDINYVIMPYNEIRQINNYIQVRQPGAIAH